MSKLFKVLDNGKSCNGGKAIIWNLPHDGQPGDWMPDIKGYLIACENGYHLCRPGDLIHWLGPEIYEADQRGEVIECDDKVVCRSVRLIHKLDTWNERSARLFASDCAEHVLHIFENYYPDDGRLRRAIEAAKRFANNEITKTELATARDAAGAAAWAATRDAAGAAAGAAIWAAARAAAWAAARDAAWAAARAAAWAAVGAAVGAATRAAARAAAWAAENEWQTEHIVSYLYPHIAEVMINV